MRKIFFSLVISIVLVMVGILLWFKRPDPQLESKFVTDTKEVLIPTLSEKEEDPSELSPSSVEIKEVGSYALIPNQSHVYQTFNNCGPATLSMILRWHGRNISQKELGDKMRPYQNQKGDNDDKTIFTYEFVDWAKKYELEAVGRINGDIDLLKKFTSNGIPVVVKTWLHINEDIGHFRLIRGFDEEKKVIIQDDSYDGPNKKISYFDFLSMWQPFNYAYIIVYKSEQENLVNTIIAGEIDEKTAWKNSLERAKKESELSPENIYPWFNISSSYYHLGDYEKSISAFENIENRLPRRMLWYQIEPIKSYQELKDYDRVFELTDKILSSGNKAFSELYQIRGEIYIELGQKDLARKEFEQAIFYNENFNKAKEALNNI